MLDWGALPIDKLISQRLRLSHQVGKPLLLDLAVRQLLAARRSFKALSISRIAASFEL